MSDSGIGCPGDVVCWARSAGLFLCEQEGAGHGLHLDTARSVFQEDNPKSNIGQWALDGEKLGDQ